MMAAPARAGTRVYLMRGLGGALFTTGVDQIGARLKRRGVTVTVGDWSDSATFERDALGHRNDRIVIGGHSAGAASAGRIGDDLFARGYQVKVVMLDPLFTGARTETRVPAVCFYNSIPCAGRARNVKLSSDRGHAGYPSDPRVQAAVIGAVRR